MEIKKFLPRILKSPTFLLVSIFTVLYLINFKFGNYWIGGDSQPILYNYRYLFNFYTWNENAGLGGVATNSSYIIFYPLISVIYSLKKLFGENLGNFIFNYIIFILIPLSFYYFINSFRGKNSSKIIITLFYALNILTWYRIKRNVLFITLPFILVPIILKVIKDFDSRKISNIILLVVLSLFLPLIFLNPAYALISIFVIIFFFLIYYTEIKTKNKKILIPLLGVLFCFSLIPVVSQMIFLVNNSVITSDPWNNALIDTALQKEKSDGFATLNIFRMIHSDFFDSWGWYDGTPLYSYPVQAVLNSNLLLFIIFVPFIILLIGLIQKKTDKKFIIWFFLLLFCIFFFKSAATPFGNVFEFLINNFSFFKIFRSPQWKFSFPIVLAASILLFFSLEAMKNRKIKLFLSSLILIYIFFFSLQYFTGEFIPKNLDIENIPEAYKLSAEFIHNREDINRLIIVPYHESTWTNTEFNYEGYNLFLFLLSDKSIYSRNSIAFSEYNRDFMEAINLFLMNNSKDPLSNLKKLNVDTVIFEGYFNRSDRFHIIDNNEDIEKYLDSFKDLDLIYTSGKIKIYKINYETSKSLVFSGYLDFQKLNPTKYKIYNQNLSEPQNLSFLESYHKNWHLYLVKNPSNEWCNPIEFYNNTNTTECEHTQKFFEGEELSYLWKKPIFDDAHTIVYDYANQWTIDSQYIKDNYSKDYYTENPDGSINVEMILYFKPQSYFYLGILISGTTFLACISYLVYGWKKERKSKKLKINNTFLLERQEHE